MLKIAGIFIIFAVSAGMGVIYSNALKEEYGRTVGFIKLIRFIKIRIECFNQPLSEIYSDFSEKALEECGFISEMRRSGYLSALYKMKNTLSLRDDIFILLTEFGSELGKSMTEEQIRLCERYIYLADEKAKEIEKEVPTKTKLVRALSVAAAAMWVIMLI